MTTSPDAPVAVVTGASRGIGNQVARELLTAGYTVVAGARSADHVRSGLADAGGDLVAIDLDVTSDADTAALGDTLATLGRGVDVLVNNAGVVLDGWRGGILDVDLDTFRDTWDTNVLGAIRVTRAVAPHLNPGARIIQVSSGMGQLSEMSGRAPAYRTSKTMLNAVTRILAAELDDVFTASVCPGWVRTDMGGESANRSVAEGADTIVWLATGADGEDVETARFWRDRAVIDW